MDHWYGLKGHGCPCSLKNLPSQEALTYVVLFPLQGPWYCPHFSPERTELRGEVIAPGDLTTSNKSRDGESGLGTHKPVLFPRCPVSSAGSVRRGPRRH